LTLEAQLEALNIKIYIYKYIHLGYIDNNKTKIEKKMYYSFQKI